MNNLMDSSLIYWNNYIETNIRSESQSDLYSYCVQNTETILDILSKFHPDYRISLDIQPGWIPLIVSLHRKILALVDNYLVYQIKEKFGSLRFYAEPIIHDAYSPDNKYHIIQIFDHLINTAETRSMQTCEICSTPGSLRTENSCYKTRCNDCP